MRTIFSPCATHLLIRVTADLIAAEPRADISRHSWRTSFFSVDITGPGVPPLAKCNIIAGFHGVHDFIFVGVLIKENVSFDAPDAA